MYYKDGKPGTFSNVFLNGVEPVRFYSVYFDYSNLAQGHGGNLLLPICTLRNLQKMIHFSLLPWAWILADPNQRPSHFELLLPKKKWGNRRNGNLFWQCSASFGRENYS